MPLLRLTQKTIGEDKFTVEVALEGKNIPRRTANTNLDFKLADQDKEDIRWYLEDYLLNPIDPNPKIAARIENRMQEIGTQLFNDIFMANNDTRKIWDKIVDELEDTRVEIATDMREAGKLPWELIFDPDIQGFLALQVDTFVYTHASPVRTPKITRTAGPIRILLVICRPGGRYDVPFRSVASRILKGLNEAARKNFQLDVLRPPTFEQLTKVLSDAKKNNQPYHILHFDGHGSFLDLKELFEKWEAKTDEQILKLLEQLINIDPNRFSPQVVYPQEPRRGGRGYLVFENPKSEHNLRLVDGPELGKLLVDSKVPLLVLNACRSAHIEVPDSPVSIGEGEDVHSQVRAFASFAQEVMDAGVMGIVAMRYNIYVVTAAQFVAELYDSFMQGISLGEAVMQGRKQLNSQPFRTIAYNPVPLRDWCVPVVYEAAPIYLFPKRKKVKKLVSRFEAGDAAPQRGALDPDLPKRPDAGFFGRDETLLALDRAFDRENIVLLHAFAGSGKTATAAEFARWYALTGGIEGPVLFTSFEQYKPLVRVLDQIERFFGHSLEQIGVNWLAMDDGQRRHVALQVLKQVPVLWIWDNVEPIAGFPRGTKSAWTDAEQKELTDFLRDARDTRTKFLLTSRRDEEVWLGNLPKRISVPAMPMQERVQLAKALAEKHGRKITDIENWRPLLKFTQGNPLTITVLVGQALRDSLKTKAQIEDFVAKLRTGEAKFEDEASEGRAKSLGASLSYGFEHAFTEQERKILALLHFFQGFVNVQVLRTMGDMRFDWALSELKGFTDEKGIALLDRAAEVGLLTAHGGGYYTIHPALPWYFRSLFEQYYPLESQQLIAESEKPIAKSEQPTATRAFVEAMSELGNYYHHEYNQGNRDVISAVTAEETNLLHAREIARQHGWWRCVISTMQGLRTLYDHTSRRAEWARLVEEIVPHFVDPATDGPLPDWEDYWSFVTEYRVGIICEVRQWNEAERLQKIRIECERKHATMLLELPFEKLDNAQHNIIRTLAVSLHELGEIQREMGQPDCVKTYEEALELSERIGDRTVAANSAFNIGSAYIYLQSIRNLAKSEHWYKRSLEFYDKKDLFGRGGCLAQLGAVVYERFKEDRAASKPEKELIQRLQNAEQYYLQALHLLPSDAVNDLAATHNQLGTFYCDTGNLDRALLHFREGILYAESSNNLYQAGGYRYNVAVALQDAGRLEDALEYAQAALGNFQHYGKGAIDAIKLAQELIEDIEKKMGK